MIFWTSYPVQKPLFGLAFEAGRIEIHTQPGLLRRIEPRFVHPLLHDKSLDAEVSQNLLCLFSLSGPGEWGALALDHLTHRLENRKNRKIDRILHAHPITRPGSTFLTESLNERDYPDRLIYGRQMTDEVELLPQAEIVARALYAGQSVPRPYFDALHGMTGLDGPYPSTPVTIDGQAYQWFFDIPLRGRVGLDSLRRRAELLAALGMDVVSPFHIDGVKGFGLRRVDRKDWNHRITSFPAALITSGAEPSCADLHDFMIVRGTPMATGLHLYQRFVASSLACGRVSSAAHERISLNLLSEVPTFDLHPVRVDLLPSDASPAMSDASIIQGCIREFARFGLPFHQAISVAEDMKAIAAQTRA